ncbi:putative (S)-ureidoglycine aminohydrolase, cupin-3 domain, rmlC-like cupin domain superfamily [Dioscorea sansibarensis]
MACSAVSSSLTAASLLLSRRDCRKSGGLGLRFGIRAETMATEKLGIKVERNPPETKLAKLGVKSWPKWGCPPSKFPWTYTAKETCYLLEGKVKVYPEGHGDEFVEIQAGDLVEFPRGMSCTWDVSVAVDKHYNFE